MLKGLGIEFDYSAWLLIAALDKNIFIQISLPSFWYL